MIPRTYGPYPDGCLRLPSIAQAIADMSMQEYALWIVRGEVPPILQAAADEEARRSAANRQLT